LTCSHVDSLTDFFVNYKYSSFDMIESDAYFQSYIHVLRKIKDMATWDKLPLGSYYINADTQSKISPYMQEILRDKAPLLQNEILKLGLDAS
jgi:hypothetical protein